MHFFHCEDEEDVEKQAEKVEDMVKIQKKKVYQNTVMRRRAEEDGEVVEEVGGCRREEKGKKMERRTKQDKDLEKTKEEKE